MLAKLRPEDGLYLIHWSTNHFNRLILTVAQKDQVGLGQGSWPVAEYSPFLGPCSLPLPCHPPQAPGGQCLRLRKFPIELHAGTFTMESWDRSFPSVRELRAALQGYLLRAGDDCFSLRHCCLPQPGGKMGHMGGRVAAPPMPALNDFALTARDLQPHYQVGASGQHQTSQPQPAQLPPGLPR